jgi:hypothetical protein
MYIACGSQYVHMCDVGIRLKLKMCPYFRERIDWKTYF